MKKLIILLIFFNCSSIFAQTYYKVDTSNYIIKWIPWNDSLIQCPDSLIFEKSRRYIISQFDISFPIFINNKYIKEQINNDLLVKKYKQQQRLFYEKILFWFCVIVIIIVMFYIIRLFIPKKHSQDNHE